MDVNPNQIPGKPPLQAQQAEISSGVDIAQNSIAGVSSSAASSPNTTPSGSPSKGSPYKGQTRADGKYHGKGEYVYDNGDVYTGEFRAGLPHGTGNYTYTSSGDIYIGSFFEGGFRCDIGAN